MDLILNGVQFVDTILTLKDRIQNAPVDCDLLLSDIEGLRETLRVLKEIRTHQLSTKKKRITEA